MNKPEEYKRRFVTVVYEITDDVAWRTGGNPLHYEHHGLKSVCVSAGDLASLNEEIEAIVQGGEELDADKYDELHTKHVMSSFPGRPNKAVMTSPHKLD
jgi:hypothetical protein